VIELQKFALCVPELGDAGVMNVLWLENGIETRCAQPRVNRVSVFNLDHRHGVVAGSRLLREENGSAIRVSRSHAPFADDVTNQTLDAPRATETRRTQASGAGRQESRLA